MEAVHACKTVERDFVFRLKAYATVMRAESENRAWQTRTLGTRHLWTRSLVLSQSPIETLDWQTDTQVLHMLTHSDTKLWERAGCTHIWILTGMIFRFWPKILGWECHHLISLNVFIYTQTDFRFIKSEMLNFLKDKICILICSKLCLKQWWEFGADFVCLTNGRQGLHLVQLGHLNG